MGLTACGFVDYKNAPAGRFDGSLLVMWVGEERFVFVPSPNRPLTFTRKTRDVTVRTIKPEMMYTDGGSIPRPARLFKGFSPWGYAPAYMVHDWLFVARQCLNDNRATPAEKATAPMPFQESAEVIAEAIKTLIETGKVQPNDIAPQAISGAVAGPIARSRWTVKGACAESRVSPEHRAEAEAAIAIRAGRRIDLRGVTPAEIVAEIAF